MPDTIKLRPHHFLCILTYAGKGHSKSFTDNFDSMINKINSGTISQIEIVAGADDICAPRLCDKTDTTCHCLEQNISYRDELALKDIQSLPDFSHLTYTAKMTITPTFWIELRKYFQQGRIRKACFECEWAPLCKEISKDNFKSSRLK